MSRIKKSLETNIVNYLAALTMCLKQHIKIRLLRRGWLHQLSDMIPYYIVLKWLMLIIIMFDVAASQQYLSPTEDKEITTKLRTCL